MASHHSNNSTPPPAQWASPSAELAAIVDQRRARRVRGRRVPVSRIHAAQWLGIVVDGEVDIVRGLHGRQTHLATLDRRRGLRRKRPAGRVCPLGQRIRARPAGRTCCQVPRAVLEEREDRPSPRSITASSRASPSASATACGPRRNAADRATPRRAGDHLLSHASTIRSASARSRTTPTTACRPSARMENFADLRRAAAQLRPLRQRPRLREEGRRPGERGLGCLDAEIARRHRKGLRRDPRRQAPRPFRRRHDAGRRRHLDQHERQRGDRQPRPRAAGPRQGRVPAPAPQRPRELLAVHQRRLPDRDQARRDLLAQGHARGDARAARRLAGEGRRSSPTS